MSIKMVSVEYIGNKPVKQDTVAGTNAVWLGAGSVVEVDQRAANQLCQHTDVWRMVNGNQPQASGPAVQQEVKEPEPETLLTHSIPAEAIKKKKVVDDTTNTGMIVPQQEGMSIVDAIMSMDRSDEAHFTPSGKPKIAAVREITGIPELTPQQVSEAWHQIKGAD